MLESIKSAPLDRKLLIQKSIKQPWILKFILDAVEKSIELGIENKTLFSFYLAFMLQYCQQIAAVSENLLIQLLPILIGHVKNEGMPEIQIAAYMIIGQLCNRSQLSEQVCTALCNAITLHSKQHPGYGMICLLKIIQSQQQLTALPQQTFETLIGWSDFIELHLWPLAKQYDCSRLHNLLIDSLLKYNNDKEWLKRLLQCDGMLSTASVVHMTERLFEIGIENENFGLGLRSVINLLQQRYPTIVQQILSAHVEKINLSNDDEDKLSQFMTIAFQGTGSEFLKEAKTSLFLALQNPEPAIRLLAVKRLLKQQVRVIYYNVFYNMMCYRRNQSLWEK